MDSKRLFIEKKADFNIEAKTLLEDFKNYLNIKNLSNLRVVNIYDITNASKEEIDLIKDNILYESQLDKVSSRLELGSGERAFRVKYVDGQFNQREDSANQLIKLLIEREGVYLRHSKLVIMEGVEDKDIEKIKDFYINPVEMEEIPLDKVLIKNYKQSSESNLIIGGFIDLDMEGLTKFKEDYGIGMDLEDVEFCQDYFKKEKRDPSLVEIKLIDTYWSDHCRHTTFETEIKNISIKEGRYEKVFQEALNSYIESRDYVFHRGSRPMTLMDLATINGRELSKKGLLSDKEDTDEVNAASIEVDVDVDGRVEKWLLMFKNETHNHPTEIEPFGGASTCLGGAIRDPLSGRSYVYQAMRITGSGEPRKKFEETLEGKLPQRTITRTAKEGYSSYGYEIGSATGYVREIYDEGYLAKRMEVGALVAGAPKENIKRGTPEPGDLIVLLGGRTGRDGVGGAVGSSQKHTEDSLENSGAEVQKGNPKIERKILRMFRRKEASRLIKVCNDFGAGGVSVAIGELADGVDINLDKVPLKYRGLNGMEIALSESQERMAALIAKEDLEEFLSYAREEDVEASLVAQVTEEKVLRMTWKGRTIVKIDRSFLDTNGIRKATNISLTQPSEEGFFTNNLGLSKTCQGLLGLVKDLNIASQKGLIEGFEQNIGRGTVLSPLGGTNRLTPAEGMVAKLPVLEGDTRTCSIMTYGFDPGISKWSPFHGGYFAVIESIARLVATGGDYRKIRFSFQEYFERLGEDPEKWGKPFLALLGAFKVQKNLDLAAIGGKDSMSGSFEDLHVPPTIISFAVGTEDIGNITSPEFKKVGSEVGLVRLALDKDFLLDLNQVKKSYKRIKDLIDRGEILSASSVKYGGYGRSIVEMALGNGIGFEFIESQEIYTPLYGSIVVELGGTSGEDLFNGLDYIKLGSTKEEASISLSGDNLSLEDLKTGYLSPLEEVFPISKPKIEGEIKKVYSEGPRIKGGRVGRPRVLIPVLPGSSGEYDLEKSFREAGGDVSQYVIKTSTREEFNRSLEDFAKLIKTSNILAFPDGQIMGSEPEANGKLYRIILNHPLVKPAINHHLNKNNGLIIGLGGGISALIKTGLLQYGYVKDLEENDIYLASNKSSGYISDFVDIELVSNLSPWFKGMDLGRIYTSPLGTKEGRLVIEDIDSLIKKGQVATVYKNNLTGSDYGVDGITSPDGRVLGMVSSPDKLGNNLYKNIRKNMEQKIFEAGINFFKED